MSKDKDPKLNYHEEENSMVNDFEDLKELGKEMEQISDQNDQEKNSEEESVKYYNCVIFSYLSCKQCIV